jgi:ribonuclease BN (tRNA processing enzyme)
MGDDEEEMAKAKTHSTIGQAIDIAKRCAYPRTVIVLLSY